MGLQSLGFPQHHSDLRTPMNRKTLLPTLLLTTGAFIFGCGVKPPIEGRQDPYASSQIHFTSEDLRTSTAFSAPKLARSDAGQILYVTVPIRATTDKTLYIDYRVTFFDKTGQVVNQN